MSDFRIKVLLTIICLAPLVSHAAEVYEIDKRVEEARAAYVTESNAIVAEIAKEIDAKEGLERDRSKPNIDKINALKADREALESDGKYPTWVAPKFKARQKKNSLALVNVLADAKSDYIRAKSDDKAVSLSAEIERLKTDGAAFPGKTASTENKSAGGTTAVMKPEAKWKGWAKGGPPPAVAPFDAQQAQQLQVLWARHLKVAVDYTNSVGMRFRLIPPGEFVMGSSPSEIDAAVKGAGDWADYAKAFSSEGPQHRVVLTQPLYIGVHEVTQSQYEKVMGTNPSGFSKTGQKKDEVGNVDTSNHPVEKVGWIDAVAFCVRLSEMEKLTPVYKIDGNKVSIQDGNGYHLPSEAEWEFMCRAGTTTRYWSGNNDADLRAQGIGYYWGTRTQAVGLLKPNPFGIYDVIGNVREWTEDFWEPTWYGSGKESPVVNSRCWQSTGDDHVVRGGCYSDMFVACRSAARLARHATNRGFDIGLRVTLMPSSSK